MAEDKLDNTIPRFGGTWTEEKLRVIQDYLKAYLQIMHKHPRAQKFRIAYVDAFAGCGWRYDKPGLSGPVLEDFEEAEAALLAGSPRKALELEKPFHRYIFVETDRASSKRLRTLQAEFPNRNIEVVDEDANTFIPRWLGGLQWNDRAVVFLDPYGMEVRWTTIECLGHSRKVDVWWLLPISAILRLLPHSGPDEAHARCLTTLWGTEEWQGYFYETREQPTLFGVETYTEREATVRRVIEFTQLRLRKAFEDGRVVDEVGILRNSKNVPLYALCFAAANPIGSRTAVEIAKDLIAQLSVSAHG